MKLEDKLFTVKTKKDKNSHIVIDQTRCRECKEKICITICPAGAYEEIGGKIEVAYENCLECGSCRVACKEDAIEWQNPDGGFGVTFING
jgi:ferredoxin like protein